MSTVQTSDSAAALEAAIDRYNAAWNAHDVDAIMAMHAPDMVFANHTAGESAQGEDVRAHIASIVPALAAERVVPLTSWPIRTRSGVRRRPIAPPAPARNMRIL